jgi:glycosyltransferase involved in cell wall biosynthesis
MDPNSSEGRRVLTISNELSKRGYDVTVASAIRTEKEKQGVESCLEHDVDIIWHKPAFRFSNFSYSPSLYQTLCEREFDLIHAHSYRHYGTYIGAVIGKKNKIPYIMSPYGSVGYESTRSLKSLYWMQDFVTRKLPLKQAEKILANTNYEKNQIIRIGVEESKIEVVYREVNTSLFKNWCNNSYDPKTVLFVGRITPIKGIELVINALNLLDKEITLKIIGQVENYDYFKSLKNLVRRNNLQDRVNFLGTVAHEELPEHYSSALTLVLSSLYENLGGVLLEAQACACPVITTVTGGTAEVLENGKTGFLLSSRSSKEIAEAINLLANDLSLRDRMGVDARRFVESKFSVEQYIDRIIRSYGSGLNPSVYEKECVSS